MKTKGVKTQSVLIRLMLPIATLLMCVVMAIGGTFALWTTDKTASVHLQAGTLNVTLGRKKLTRTVLKEDGTMETVTYATSTDGGAMDDFSGTDSNGRNVFGLTNGEKIVPGMSFEATMTIQNSGVVACEYQVIIRDPDDEDLSNTTLQSNGLAQQINVYVNDELKGKLSEVTVIYDETLTRSGASGSNDTFTVKLEFPREGNVQSGTVNFDLLVRAEQKTA